MIYNDLEKSSCFSLELIGNINFKIITDKSEGKVGIEVIAIYLSFSPFPFNYQI